MPTFPHDQKGIHKPISSHVGRRVHIISIFGPDGAGKTTHARLLAYKLKRKGFKVKHVWIKNNHTLAYIMLKFLEKISPQSVLRLPTNAIITHILAYSNSISRTIWSWLELISVITKLIINVYIPRLFGYTIIADRYLPDTIIHMTIATKSLEILQSIPVKTLLKILAKDKTKLIMLDSSYKTIKNRRNNICEPRQLIEIQRLLYKKIAKILNVPIEKTDNKNIAETHLNIIRILT